MSTNADQNITSSDAQFAQRFASTVHLEGIVKNPVVKFLSAEGCLNMQNELEQERGGKVTMYNRNRIDSLGYDGDIDFYSAAEFQETNSRTLDIVKNSLPTKWRTKGSQDQQYAPYMLDDGCIENITDWVAGLMCASFINQVAGNNASSITNYTLSSSNVFTGSDLLRITGNNAAAAPTYWYEGNLGGAITTAAGIGSGNTLSLKDFEVFTRVVTSNTAGRTTWQILNNAYYGVAFISWTGIFQLYNDAVTLGQGQQITEIMKAKLAGGDKTAIDLDGFVLPGYPVKFVPVPDSWMPRGVTTSGLAETANTRRCVIVGKNALDVAFGQGMRVNLGNLAANGRGVTSGRTVTLPGVNVEIDNRYKPLNKEVFANASLLWGCKKARSTGSGAYAATSYDMATYVIDHYSAD